MRMRNKPALIFFCLLLSAATVLAGVNIYSELKERQKEKEDFASVAEIAKLPMTEAPAESVTDTETETAQSRPSNLWQDTIYRLSLRKTPTASGG